MICCQTAREFEDGGGWSVNWKGLEYECKATKALGRKQAREKFVVRGRMAESNFGDCEQSDVLLVVHEDRPFGWGGSVSLSQAWIACVGVQQRCRLRVEEYRNQGGEKGFLSWIRMAWGCTKPWIYRNTLFFKTEFTGCTMNRNCFVRGCCLLLLVQGVKKWFCDFPVLFPLCWPVASYCICLFTRQDCGIPLFWQKS